MKRQNVVRKSLIVAILLATGLSSLEAAEQTVHERMLHHRAVDAAVWAMPLMSFKFYRDALADAGVRPNDIGYFSKIQDWRMQAATPNNTTPYILIYWNIEDGPVVIEIPPSARDVGIFGTLMDAWQRPIDDVGAAGRDKGRGAKYLLIPPGYDEPLLPNALVYEQRTNHGFTAMRPIIADSSPENVAKAIEFARQIRIYPLAKAANPPDMKFVDLYGKMLEMIPKMDRTIYKHIHEMIQEEVVEEQNMAMMGLLARLGIKKGEPFESDAKLQAVFDRAAPDALQYMIEQYHRFLNPLMYEGKKWSVLAPPGAIETDFSYKFPGYFDYHARGALYYAIITSVKNYGTATFYLDLAETPDGKWLDGGKTYRLVVPANVPVRDFWAVTAYDLESASYIRKMGRNSLDSNQAELKKNKDGSVDVYFGPKAPKGKESNWIPTTKGRRFFLLFRFYGPKPAVFDRSWELNDIELID